MDLHQKIVRDLCEEYKQKSSTVAITLFGSMAKDKHTKESDIDIQIISEDAKEWELIHKEKEGIIIDLVICPKDHLFYQLREYPYLCYDYLNEKILFDPDNVMKNFRRVVKEYFEKHPEVVKFWKNKLRIMKDKKLRGEDDKSAVKSYDEAEILFSGKHKVTRDFFR